MASSFKHRIEITAEDKASAVFRAVGSSAQGFGRKLADTTATIAHSIAIAQALVSAIKAIAAPLAEATRLASEQERVEVKLAAVLRATKGAAGLTAKELGTMARELQRVTTFGDEAILGAQGILATFTKIGRDVFPQATETMLDMATVLGQDLKAGAIQLGKALNDPITGATALRRVGVSLSEQQQDLIKDLVGSNDLLGAQRVILDELAVEFGGTARAMTETFGGAIDQTKNAWGDFMEKVGDFVVKSAGARVILQEIIGLLDGWSSSLEDARKDTDRFQRVSRGMIDVVGEIAHVVLTMADAFIRINEAVLDFAGTAAAIAGVDLPPVTRELRKQQEEVDRLRKEYLGARSGLEAMRDTMAFVGENADDLGDDFADQEAAIAALGVALAMAEAKYSQLSKATAAEGVNFDPALDGIRKLRVELDAILERAKLAPGAVAAIDVTATPIGDTTTLADFGAAAGEAWISAFIEALEAEAARLEAFWQEAFEVGDEIAGAALDSISNRIVDHSTSWKEEFEDFGESVKASLLDAFLEPILGAGSALSDLAGVAAAPFVAVGQAIEETLFRPLIDGILKFFGIRSAAEKAAAAATVATQTTAAAGIAASQGAVVAGMMPGLSAAAAASLVATFGAAGAAAGLLPAILAAGAAQGQTAAATLATGLARGGRVEQPTHVLLGENYRPEVVIPETRPDRARPLLGDLFDRRPELLAGLFPARPAAAAGPSVTFAEGSIQISAVDGDQVADQLLEALNDRLGELVGRIG